jgi:hypothetical protein
MLSHFLKFEFRPDMSIEKSADRLGLQQLQDKSRWNTKVAVDFAAVELGLQDSSRFLVANPSQFRRLDRLLQHATSPREAGEPAGSKL